MNQMCKDLLDQAEHLASWDEKGKPKQANLRRAVSATYYAIFHYLVQKACTAQLGTGNESEPYRRILARAFDHAQMKQACESIVTRGKLQNKLGQGFPLSPLPDEITYIAFTFVRLQEERNHADYNLMDPFHRSDVLHFIDLARGAIEYFDALSTAYAERDFFLACLWAWKGLDKRVRRRARVAHATQPTGP